MNKDYLVVMTNNATGDYIVSATNNPTQRAKSLKRSISIVNARPLQKPDDRFNVFNGCNPETDVTIRIFKEVLP